MSLATLYFNENEGFPDVTIYGFDVDNPTIYKARQKVAKHDTNLPIHFFNGQETPLHVHGKYDAIFANSVLCHHDPDAGLITVETIKSRFTFHDFEAVLLELDAVLNDGGLLAMVNTNYYFNDTILADRYEALAQCAGDFVPKIDIKKHVLVENHEMRKTDCVWRKRKS
jgi:SAM-dependent methyltransferase